MSVIRQVTIPGGETYDIARKVTKNASTLLLANWVTVQQTTPETRTVYTYSFETDYPNATYNIEVEVAPSATIAQFDEFGKAKILGSATTNVITAFGVKPTGNIPIIITAEEK